MSKYKNYIITILTFLLSFIIQHRLVNMGLINPENLAMDLISWLVIFITNIFNINNSIRIKNSQTIKV